MMCGVLESALGGLNLEGYDRSRRRASRGVVSFLTMWLSESDWKSLVVGGGGSILVERGGLIVAMAARAGNQ